MPVPEPRPGDVVVMDTLSSRKGPRVRAPIEAAGAGLRFLPPRSADFNPIENAFAKLKALPRKAAGGAAEGLRAAIDRIADAFAPRMRRLLQRLRIRSRLVGGRSSRAV